jgi:large subunit ribosomal protein L10
MALTKDKKNDIIAEVSKLLADSKMTVIATYQGTPVKAMQQLRRDGQETQTVLKVVKNRLVKKAIETTENVKGVNTSNLTGMLLYAFNNTDEVAPAQVLATFAKTQPTIEFVGAISADGTVLSADEVKSLAALPGREELIGQVLATLTSPVNDVMSGLAGNLHAILDAVATKAE